MGIYMHTKSRCKLHRCGVDDGGNWCELRDSL